MMDDDTYTVNYSYHLILMGPAEHQEFFEEKSQTEVVSWC